MQITETLFFRKKQIGTGIGIVTMVFHDLRKTKFSAYFNNKSILSPNSLAFTQKDQKTTLLKSTPFVVPFLIERIKSG